MASVIARFGSSRWRDDDRHTSASDSTAPLSDRWALYTLPNDTMTRILVFTLYPRAMFFTCLRYRRVVGRTKKLGAKGFIMYSIKKKKQERATLKIRQLSWKAGRPRSKLERAIRQPSSGKAKREKATRHDHKTTTEH